MPAVGSDSRAPETKANAVRAPNQRQRTGENERGHQCGRECLALLFGRGEEVEIEIVAFNAGLHMLRADTSPVKDRVTNALKALSNVSFKACKNTMDAMERSEGKPVPLLPKMDIVEAGVTRLIELSEQGWTIVRP
jgi:intracellular sulfur oxidation DsrE/DsrF family protein